MVRYANGNIFRFKGENIYSSFDIQMAQSLSNQLNAKFFQIDRLEKLDTVINQIL
ncbi:hypothetical protein KKH82_02435 [Patescibacteria group bacterium]|nr:hypothetical protein [Patescibacteria group bacterium]